MRLLLDEMYGPALASALRDRGHAILAIAEEPGLRGLDDRGVLLVAEREHRIVVTGNVGDFARLHGELLAAGLRHPGIVLVPSRPFPRGGRDVGRLATALDAILVSPPSPLLLRIPGEPPPVPDLSRGA